MRLIDVDALKESIEKDTCPVNISYFYRKMQETHTIDAEPVRYGYWIAMSDFDGEYYYCSECGEELPRYSCTFPTPTKPFSLMKSVDKTNHCPNCGAKMY